MRRQDPSQKPTPRVLVLDWAHRTIYSAIESRCEIHVVQSLGKLFAQMKQIQPCAIVINAALIAEEDLPQFGQLLNEFEGSLIVGRENCPIRDRAWPHTSGAPPSVAHN